VKLKTLKLANFRSYESFSIDFDEKLNVIVAENGIGKTTILDAIALGFGAMLTRIPNVNGKSFEEKDLRFYTTEPNKKAPYMRAEIDTYENISWDRTQARDKSNQTKSQIPQGKQLKVYTEQNPHANWENDFKNSCQDGYKEVISQLKIDQGGIYCYCELNFSDGPNIRDDFRVEHFHPKSDSNEDKNWDLGWQNLFGCCHGGSEKRTISSERRYIDNKNHRHSDVLKGALVWDDEILNPLEIPAFPAIFEVMPSSGEMRVVEIDCLPELKQKVIISLDEKKLNLNTPKLKEWRKAVIDKLREDVDRFVSGGVEISDAVNTIVNAQLSKDSYGNYPRFLVR
jgi:uncharacterized protein (TIGR02646 family)